MKYYLEAKPYALVHKNKQHTALTEMIKEVDGILLYNEGAKDKIVSIIIKWSEKINRDYPRCKDVQLRGRKSLFHIHGNFEEWNYIQWPGIGEMRFHEVKEEWR